MELAFVVYLISILENIGGLFVGIAYCSLMIAVFICICEIGNITHKKTILFLVFIGLVFGSLRAMLPSEKQAYAIAAAYGAQQVYQSEEAKQIGNRMLKAINNKLDELGEKEKK